ncbi:hypothetical protein [Roseibium sp.]|uniref:hypothetical protein n=1 Tax=Roseibium sp. TaxID=1936156 RepID=UPI003BA9934A
MKKQRKSSRPKDKKSRHNTEQQQANGVSPERRKFLRLGRNIGIAAVLLGGTGYVFAQNFASMRHEHDLTRVGNGRPTVVQIHDPQCSLCRSLQADTRKALDMFEDGELDYVVANIRTAKGKTFQNRYGVPHVTLLLFDSKGDLQEVLQGQRGAYELRNHFQALLDG